jgi:deoxyribodipyrimidine photo-lyase
MRSVIQPARIHFLNERKRDGGDYVLYWMQASQRTRLNHALEFAVEQANERDLPLRVCFGLMDDYPEANERHYAFMLRGLADVSANLKKRGIGFVIRRGNPADVALGYAKRAALLVCDRGYLRHQKRWRDKAADEAACPVVQVESDVVVPVEEASDKAEYAARTIRPKIHRLWEKYLVPQQPGKIKQRADGAEFDSDIDLDDLPGSLATLKIDRSVPISKRFVGASRKPVGY